MEEPKYCVAFTADDRFCSLCNQCKGCVELAKNYKSKINTTMSKEPINYVRIPLSEIDPEARRIAVAWVDGFQKVGGIEIEQKHKLASDIMNYSQSQLSEYKQKLKEEIKNILFGINKEQTQAKDGWWETSFGAEFGQVKLNEVLTLIDKI